MASPLSLVLVLPPHHKVQEEASLSFAPTVPLGLVYCTCAYSFTLCEWMGYTVQWKKDWVDLHRNHFFLSLTFEKRVLIAQRVHATLTEDMSLDPSTHFG